MSKPLDAAEAIRDARDADDMLEWLSKRASIKEKPFDVWHIEIRFDLDCDPPELDEPSLREAIRRAMEKERR